jgi:hypothetical protein
VTAESGRSPRWPTAGRLLAARVELLAEEFPERGGDPLGDRGVVVGERAAAAKTSPTMRIMAAP